MQTVQHPRRKRNPSLRELVEEMTPDVLSSLSSPSTVKDNKKLIDLISKIITECSKPEPSYPKTKEEEIVFGLLLVKIIRLCSDMYYKDGSSFLTDDKFDILKDILEKLGTRHHEVAGKIAQTLPEVGSTPEATSVPYQHKTSMLSQDKVNSLEDLTKWMVKTIHKVSSKIARRNAPHLFLIEPKIDGVALKLVYEQGFLTHVATRGDGHIGEEHVRDVFTSRPMQVKGAIPTQLTITVPSDAQETGFEMEHMEIPDLLVITGEAIILKDAFDAINKDLESQGKQVYATLRHATVGLINAGNFKPISFIVHGCDVWTKNDTSCFTHDVACLRWLKFVLAFSVVPFEVIDCPDDEQQVYQCLKKHLAYEAHQRYPFAIDGLVIKVYKQADRNRLGCTRHAPRWSIAYKFPAETSSSQLINVLWSVSRTGVLTPVAHFHPVRISNVYIGTATLHNPKKIKQLDLHEDDIVTIARANDVIPAITGVITDLRKPSAKPVEIPVICPECNTTLVQVNESRLVCPNKRCPGRITDLLAYVASQGVFDLKYVRRYIVPQLEIFVLNKILLRPEDYFKLKEEDLSILTIKSQRKESILKELEACRGHLTPTQVLMALSIEGVNKAFIEKLEARYDVKKLPRLVVLQDDKKFTTSAVFTRFEKALEDTDIKKTLTFFKTFAYKEK